MCRTLIYKSKMWKLIEYRNVSSDCTQPSSVLSLSSYLLARHPYSSRYLLFWRDAVGWRGPALIGGYPAHLCVVNWPLNGSCAATRCQYAVTLPLLHHVSAATYDDTYRAGSARPVDCSTFGDRLIMSHYCNDVGDCGGFLRYSTCLLQTVHRILCDDS